MKYFCHECVVEQGLSAAVFNQQLVQVLGAALRWQHRPQYKLTTQVYLSSVYITFQTGSAQI